MTDFDPDKLKHKPNEKHTLDEVLKSLQDLIHNDLLKGEAARAKEAPTPEPEPAPTVEETPADTASGDIDAPAALPDIAIPAADVPLGAVVQSLEELIKNDLTLTDDIDQMPAAAIPDAEPTPIAPDTPATPAAPATGQQAFSFDADAGTPAPAEPEPILAPAIDEPEPSLPVAESSDFDEFTVDLAPPPGDFTKTENEVEREAVVELPPDLPVLTETVSEAAMPPIDDLPVLEEIALGSPENNPAAIAARVVAHLNADRRARGEAELDDATLEALRALLRDEIERHQSER